jgi:hypothetical protein
VLAKKGDTYYSAKTTAQAVTNGMSVTLNPTTTTLAALLAELQAL